MSRTLNWLNLKRNVYHYSGGDQIRSTYLQKTLNVCFRRITYVQFVVFRVLVFRLYKVSDFNWQLYRGIHLLRCRLEYTP